MNSTMNVSCPTWQTKDTTERSSPRLEHGRCGRMRSDMWMGVLPSGKLPSESLTYLLSSNTVHSSLPCSFRYDLVEKRVIEFNQVALQRPDMRNSDDVFNRVMSFDNIAVVCLLENSTTGSRLIVSNVHMHWDPIFRDVKLVQAAMLVEELEKVSEQFAKFPPKLLADNKRGPSYSDSSKIPLIICGDFNSIPSSGVYEFLSVGDVAGNHEDFMDHLYGSYTTDGLSHKLNLKSAYGSVGELPMTNYTPSFEGVIDYIWYTQGSLAITSLLGEVDQAYLAKVVGFPNAHFPSEYVFFVGLFF